MKKLTYALLVTFLASLATSTWTASAAESSAAPRLQVGNKAGGLQHAKAKAKKSAKKHAHHHKKQPAKKASA